MGKAEEREKGKGERPVERQWKGMGKGAEHIPSLLPQGEIKIKPSHQ